MIIKAYNFGFCEKEDDHNPDEYYNNIDKPQTEKTKDSLDFK